MAWLMGPIAALGGFVGHIGKKEDDITIVNDSGHSLRVECNFHHANMDAGETITRDWAHSSCGIGKPDVTVWFERDGSNGKLMNAGQTITYDGSRCVVSG